ncbi:MAG: 1,4-dihydroxy-2-naphthoate octaprenyltransferase [Candidatus Kapabacteria bacterium]|nr:1,4-dihydroxy-2-naphthoate octaprenyltransferase [Ignavibacteriota bacterium]MCW5886244.1 1,4-dihydroxy-2-naphthoate octaprenyltransferase [Candidatus Kapabacteria bacterium]
MSSAIATSERSQLSLWIQAARTFSFPASVVPMLVGIMWTLAASTGTVYWELVPVILIAGVLFHAGSNMVNDYFDYKKGVDIDESYGSSRIIVEGLLSPKAVLNGGLLMFAIGFALGMILVYYHGLPIFVIGIIGLLGGLLYTGFNVAYKYYALGDIFVFLMFGPMMVLGTNTALTGNLDYNTFFVSIPIGLLTVAILTANNIRDIKHDRQAKVSTMATLLGVKASVGEYYFLIFGAFASVVIMVALGFLTPWTLIVLISIKPAIDNVKFISKADENKPEEIMIGDVRTAQHNLMFGVLYSIGILIGVLV